MAPPAHPGASPGGFAGPLPGVGSSPAGGLCAPGAGRAAGGGCVPVPPLSCAVAARGPPATMAPGACRCYSFHRITPHTLSDRAVRRRATVLMCYGTVETVVVGVIPILEFTFNLRVLECLSVPLCICFLSMFTPDKESRRVDRVAFPSYYKCHVSLVIYMYCSSFVLFVVIGFILFLGEKESPWELRSVILMVVSSGIRVSHLIICVLLHGNLGRLSAYMDPSKGGTYNEEFELLDEKIRNYQKRRVCKRRKHSDKEHKIHKMEDKTTKHSDEGTRLFEDAELFGEEQMINDGIEQYVLGY